MQQAVVQGAEVGRLLVPVGAAGQVTLLARGPEALRARAGGQVGLVASLPPRLAAGMTVGVAVRVGTGGGLVDGAHPMLLSRRPRRC